jgi:uncharacterized protein (DUF2235 family)
MDNFMWTPQQIFAMTIKQVYTYMDHAAKRGMEQKKKEMQEQLAAQVHGGGGGGRMNSKMMRKVF